LLGFRYVFPSTVPCAAYPFFLKMTFFKHEILCFKHSSADVPALCGVGQSGSSLMSRAAFAARSIRSGSFILAPARCCGARGCPSRGHHHPAGCRPGACRSSLGASLHIPTSKNFGCNVSATSPPFLSSFRQLAFWRN